MRLKKTNDLSKVNPKRVGKGLLILFFCMSIGLYYQGCSKEGGTEKLDSQVSEPNLLIIAPELESAIYLDGVYTGKTTPNSLLLEPGDYIIGVGLKDSRNYLRRSVTITEKDNPVKVELNQDDLQNPKKWKALFIGINDVETLDGGCSNHYSTEELDLAFDYFKWSFEENVEDYSYNTMDWEFTRRDISDQVVTLSSKNYLTPSMMESHLTDVKKGDFDLIVTFFKGSDQNCFDAGFLGLAWYNVTELDCNASYFMVRYHEDIEDRIPYAKQNDPGVFIHEWLHTVAERFYPNKGIAVPQLDNGQVVHAAEKYGYKHPWMKWYKDIISGQVKDGYRYVGIGPDAWLDCSVREGALSQ